MKENWNFSHRWDLFVAAEAWNPPLCCTVERDGLLFMSKDVELKLRQWRGVFGTEAKGCAVEVEEEEHGDRLDFYPSVRSNRCRGSLEPPGVLNARTRWFSVHVEKCGMEAETGA